MQGSMGKISCLIISLGSQTRNSELLAQLESQGIAGEILSAVDGRLWGPDKIDSALVSRKYFTTIMDRNPTGPEVACAMSHLNAYRVAVERGDQELLVLEEDAEIVGDIGPAIERIRASRKSSPVIITLFSGESQYFRRKTGCGWDISPNTEQMFRRFFLPPSHTVAYLANRAALEEMSKMRQVELTADWPPSTYHFEFWAQIPYPVMSSPDGSTIEGWRYASMRKSLPRARTSKIPWHLFSLKRSRAYGDLLGSMTLYVRNIFMPHVALYFSLFLDKYTRKNTAGNKK